MVCDPQSWLSFLEKNQAGSSLAKDFLYHSTVSLGKNACYLRLHSTIQSLMTPILEKKVLSIIKEFLNDPDTRVHLEFGDLYAETPKDLLKKEVARKRAESRAHFESSEFAQVVREKACWVEVIQT